MLHGVGQKVRYDAGKAGHCRYDTRLGQPSCERDSLLRSPLNGGKDSECTDIYGCQ